MRYLSYPPEVQPYKGIIRRRLWLANMLDDDDMHQELIIAVWNAVANFDPACGYTIFARVWWAARRRMGEERRARSGIRRKHNIEFVGMGEEEAHTVASEAPGPDSIINKQELALFDLNKLHPAIVTGLQSIVLGETHREAAARLGVPENTFAERQRKAIDRLRAQLFLPPLVRKHGPILARMKA